MNGITKEVKAQFLKNVTEFANKWISQNNNNSAEIAAENVMIRNAIMQDVENMDKLEKQSSEKSTNVKPISK